jgi:hypothetical protein
MHIKRKLSSKNARWFHPWEAPLIQVCKSPFINGAETPHQPSPCSVMRISIDKPNTQPTRNLLQWITKHQKHITYKQTKTTKCRKEQQNLNFWHPQPLRMPNCPVVCHLLPFIDSILGFAHFIHPQKETWHDFSVTTISEQLLMRKMQIKVVNLCFKSFSRTVSEQVFLAWKMQILFQ